MSIRNHATLSRRTAAEIDAAADRALAALDPARAARPDAAQGLRGQALLERVLNEPRPTTIAGAAEDTAAASASHLTWRPGRGGRSWPSGRWVLTGSAVALVTAGLIAMPLVPSPSVSAAWTAVPVEMSPAEVDALAQECLTQAQAEPDTPEFSPPHGPSADDYAQMLPVLGERRGDGTFVIVANDAWLVDCWSDGAGTYGMGFITLPRVSEPVAPGAVEPLSRGTVRTSGESSRSITGRVGPDVTGVDITTSAGVTVESTVAGGVFAAWWPEGIGPGDMDPTATDIELTAHLADGTVVGGMVPSDSPGWSYEELDG